MIDEEKIKKIAEKIIIDECPAKFKNAEYFVVVDSMRIDLDDDTVSYHVDYNDYVTAHIILVVTPKCWDNTLRQAKLIAFL